jgi:hypothetical protein
MPDITYKNMIDQAINELTCNGQDPACASRQAITKYINANYKVGGNCDYWINRSIRNGVYEGRYKQPRGPAGFVQINTKRNFFE